MGRWNGVCGVLIVWLGERERDKWLKDTGSKRERENEGKGDTDKQAVIIRSITLPTELVVEVQGPVSCSIHKGEICLCKRAGPR